MSKKPEFKSISVKEEFAEDIESFIYQHPSLGYRSIAQFLEDSARRRLEELKEKYPTPPKFEHFNKNDVVRIIEHKPTGEIKAVADLFFRSPDIIFCDFDKATSCEHIDFALTVPAIRKIISDLNKKGNYRIELPDV